MPTKRPRPSTLDLELEVQDYLQNRSMRERSEHREKRIKDELMSTLERAGELQEGGHRIIRLAEPIPYAEYKGGKAKDRSVGAIRRVRRTSQRLNEVAAMALLQRKKLLEQCTRTEIVLDEDALLAAAFEGKLTDDEVQSLYEESENFAFFIIDADKEDDDA
jgi:hypothetical protein